MARPTIFTKGRAYFNTYITPELNEWLVKYCHDQSRAKGRMVSRSAIVRELLEEKQREHSKHYKTQASNIHN